MRSVLRKETYAELAVTPDCEVSPETDFCYFDVVRITTAHNCRHGLIAVCNHYDLVEHQRKNKSDAVYEGFVRCNINCNKISTS